MEETLKLIEYVRMLKKRWKLLLLIPIVALITSSLLSNYLLSPVYRASITLIVGKSQNQINTEIPYESILANQQLIKTYSEIAKSRSVLKAVVDTLNLDVSVEQLQKMVSVTPLNNTELLLISVEAGNPEKASLIANGIGKAFSQKILEIKKVDNVSIVDYALTPQSPIRPNQPLNLIVAGFGGLLTALGLILLLEYFDDTLKDSEDIERRLGLPVLGAIPKMNAVKKQKARVSQ